jgi:tetratricopeptide (TPR) repeat protein
LYFILRTHALGLTANGALGPIDNLSLWGRLMTTPSIILFYLATFIFPLHLAHAYYWTYPTPTFSHFVLPLLVDLGFIGLIIYTRRLAQRKLPPAYVMTLNFFALWFLLGLALISQVVPLDLTASDAWFYFPIVGLLGMIGIVVMMLPARTPRYILVTISCAVIVLLGIRTSVRSHDWSSDATLASHDIKYSPDDYNSEFAIARSLALEHNYNEARIHAQRAADLFPTNINYELLGAICIWSGDLPSNERVLIKGLTLYPNDATLWLDKAIIEENAHDFPTAKVSVSHAYKLAPTQQVQGYYTAIMAGQPLNLSPGN